MEDTTDDMEIQDQDDDRSTYDSSFSSPVGLSNGDNSTFSQQEEEQEKGNSINDTTRSSSETDRSWEENSSTYDSPFDSPVGLSSFENSINTHVGEPDIQIEDQERGNFVNDTPFSPDETDSSYGSPDRVSSPNSPITTHIDEPDVSQEDREIGNSVNDTIQNLNTTDLEIRGREEDNSAYNSSSSSPVQISKSGNSVNVTSQNDATLYSAETTDIDIRGHKVDSSIENSLSSPAVNFSMSENSKNTRDDEPDHENKHLEKGNSENDGTLDSTLTDIDTTANSSLVSNSENSINALAYEPDTRKEDDKKVEFLNDTTLSSISDDVNTDTSTTNRSPVLLSNSENSIIDVAYETDTLIEDNKKIVSVIDTILGSPSDGVKTRDQENDNITANISPVLLTNFENSTNPLAFEPDTFKQNNEKSISLNDTTPSSLTDAQSSGQQEDNSNSIADRSPVRFSNSENSINALAIEPNGPKEQNDLEEDNSTANRSAVQLPDTENSVNFLTPKGENEKSNLFNVITFISTSPNAETRDQEEDNSTANKSLLHQLLDSENSMSFLTPKEQNEKSNLFNDITFSSISTNVETREQGEDNYAPNRSLVQLQDSENSVNFLTPRDENERSNLFNDTKFNSENSIHFLTPRVENEKNNLFNDTKFNSENSINFLTPRVENEKSNLFNDKSTNVAIRLQEEDNSNDFQSPAWISNSENSTSALSSHPGTQEEDNENTAFFSDVTLISPNAEESKILNRVIDKEDTQPFFETITVTHESAEKMEMKPKDISNVTCNEDFEEIGESSSSIETGNLKNETIDATSSKKVVLCRSRDPKVDMNRVAWAGKDLALAKFLKFKSLYTVSNIFRNLSKKKSRLNECNEYDNDMSEVNSNEKGRQPQRSLSLIRTAHENNMGNKMEVDEVALETPELKSIKGRIVLYTKLWCKFCKEARIFLRRRSLRYSEVNIDVYPSRKAELEEITGSSEVPKVFFNHDLIGGLNDLKALDESGKLEEKIEIVTSEIPSPKAPLPPFSGEDDVSSKSHVDEIALIVRKMKESIIVKDRFYKFRRVTSCFLGSDAVDFLSEDQFLERREAIEFGRKLARELFFRHVLEENIFEDGNHLYRFLDHDPIISQCQNIPRGLIVLKRQPLVEISYRLRYLLYAILDAYTSEDGKHVAYRTIHGSEEFARYLRIVEELQRLDLNRTAKEERLAFFINLYNLMTIHAILVWGHPEGAFERRKLLSEFRYVIGGRAYSLSDIHNGILRSNQRAPYTLSRPFRINDKRFKVSLPYPEPLINFALVSGNRSSPPLRCYSPTTIDTELMEAARNFIQSGAFVLQIESMTISVHKILEWYSVDFGKNVVEVIKHASNYLEVEQTRTLLELIANSTELKVVYQQYDWRLNS